ncbi:IS1 family transposase, partial [Klebsiella pneumoniae]|nr:IS1 family transposase [Klebsiella pneumoniae]MCJ3936915.1 IS1 family transposase [Klebsiella pneumoniae]MCJ4239950.1 IS1 family transposase [Klebsiella pneumoniae]MCJ4295124.1 IS1 family transposase [Klebsiella pneumoniae]
CAAPSAKGDDKFITTDYLQQCLSKSVELHDKVIGHYLNIKHYQ